MIDAIGLAREKSSFDLWAFFAFAIVAMSGNSLFAQTDFFWSFQDLNSGAVNADASRQFSVGESGTLFMYYTTNGPANSDLDVGAFLDVATSMAGIIAITDAETFDFHIDGTNLNRWLDSAGQGGSAGHTGTISDDGQRLDEWNAFTVNAGDGIREANNGSGATFDPGYDAGADAFLFGQLDVVTIGTGTTELTTVSAAHPIEHAGPIVPATYGGATINVGAIPEPSSLAILAALLAVLTNRRRGYINDNTVQ